MSQSKMPVGDGDEKTFAIQHVFKDVMNLKKNEYHSGPTKIHHDIPWEIGIRIDISYMCFFLACERFHGSEKWSVPTQITMIINKQDGEEDKFSIEHVYNQSEGSNSYLKLITFLDANKYIVNGDLTVKFEVKIGKMEGIKGKLRNFDKESAEKFSDVVLVVGEEKFYVLKKYLSQHSTYFEALLLGNFSESEKLEIELKDVDSWDFQNFLEVLYGESAIDDDTVDGILKLADMFDAPTATRRCQEFLLEKSKQSLSSKFKIAAKYQLVEVVNQCLSEMKSSADISAIMPKEPSEYENWILVELLKKLLDFKSA